MAVPPFTQNVIAVVWDFDKTLLPTYMQKPLFARFGVDENQFWAEVNALPNYYARRGEGRVAGDTIYLSHILTYVRANRFPGLNNAMLRELGSHLEFYPGIPDFLSGLKQNIESDTRFAKHDIKVEHYIVSTGLRQMIRGSAVAEDVDEIWACEFLESTAPPGFLQVAPANDHAEPMLQNVGYAIDNTTKTRAIFEINKGVSKHPEMDVNDRIAPENRRVPIENMIYVADGPSDVLVFSILNQYGGKTFAVYNPASEKEFRQVVRLQEQGRVTGLGAADYTPGSQTARWLTYWAEDIAIRIAERRERALEDSLGKPPQHIVEPPATEAPQDQVSRLAAERAADGKSSETPQEAAAAQPAPSSGRGLDMP